MTTPARISRTGLWREGFIAAKGARCHYCNRTGSLAEGPGQRPWHIDHMTPLARGGEDVESNLTLSCQRCNVTKNAQPYKTFVAFARAAFWQPTDGISEGELDALMTEWTASTDDGDRLWLVSESDHEHAIVSAPSGEGPGEYGALPIMRTVSGACEGLRTARFLVSAHRLVPHLIAEVRQLRAAEDAS